MVSANCWIEDVIVKTYRNWKKDFESKITQSPTVFSVAFFFLGGVVGCHSQRLVIISNSYSIPLSLPIFRKVSAQ